MAVSAKRIVVDSGFILEAILPDPRHAGRQAQALDLIDAIASGAVVARVPWIFFVECAAVLARAVRGGRPTEAIARAFLTELEALPFEVDRATPRGPIIFANAMAWRAGGYDSLYLAAAKEFGAELAAFDRGARQAAGLAGVALYLA